MVACAEIAKIAEVEPDAIVTDAGTVAAAELEPSRTTAPPAGAGPPMVAVPCALVPPVTDDGETDTPVSALGVTVNVALFTVPL